MSTGPEPSPDDRPEAPPDGVAVARAHDGRDPATALTDAVLGELGASEVEALVG